MGPKTQSPALLVRTARLSAVGRMVEPIGRLFCKWGESGKDWMAWAMIRRCRVERAELRYRVSHLWSGPCSAHG